MNKHLICKLVSVVLILSPQMLRSQDAIKPEFAGEHIQQLSQLDYSANHTFENTMEGSIVLAKAGGGKPRLKQQFNKAAKPKQRPAPKVKPKPKIPSGKPKMPTIQGKKPTIKKDFNRAATPQKPTIKKDFNKAATPPKPKDGNGKPAPVLKPKGSPPSPGSQPTIR